jgi:transposase
MLNINKINKVYIACGVTDLRKNIDGLSIVVQTELKLDPFEKALFVFCNRQMNKLKILHFDEGFWLYQYRLERGRLKWPMNKTEAVTVKLEDLRWLLQGYELKI